MRVERLVHGASGSSPRPWGTPEGGHGVYRQGRFIPTPVGNTASRWAKVTKLPVHPHARGEHPLNGVSEGQWAGSSPRPWGTRPNTGPNTGRTTVHPHARGEHFEAATGNRPYGGSSPRPWGTREDRRQSQERARFIPTPVGNTPSSSSTPACVSVHPHARGEHWNKGRLEPLDLRFIPTPVGNTALVHYSASPAAVHPHARGEHVGWPWRLTPWGRFIPTPVGNTVVVICTAPGGPVHPHARGEHGLQNHVQPVQHGSSPRPWGTLMLRPSTRRRSRFIPTPVGNTRPCGPGARAVAVHPHARGEHSGRPQPSRANAGSSPRPWGTPGLLGRAAVPSRFIPTPVGNTSYTVSPAGLVTVHPHARGEHGYASQGPVRFIGSSPRPWGTLNPWSCPSVHHRFIPTPVGNTPADGGCPAPRAVHPHARGEHSSRGKPTPYGSGSSPRPWGTLSHPRHAAGDPRFIPTPVGNTPWPPAALPRPAVHPHARGEHVYAQPINRYFAGSSPRPWGTQRQPFGHLELVRFIPTPVGNTLDADHRQVQGTVHPHARGEHCRSVTGPSISSGSSPRPWGTRGRRARPQGQPRFIPTPVGNTSSGARWIRLRSVHPHARGEH